MLDLFLFAVYIVIVGSSYDMITIKSSCILLLLVKSKFRFIMGRREGVREVKGPEYLIGRYKLLKILEL